MSLYLAIFNDDDGDEIDGVEVGHYSDFDEFRTTVVRTLESGAVGSRFPTLILHSDCDGSWTPLDAVALVMELETIAHELKRYPAPQRHDSTWQGQVMRTMGLKPANLYEYFFDVDGEPLLERLLKLAKLSIQSGRPILFQ